MTWCTDAKRSAPIAEVAAALAMTGGGRAMGPCPACGATSRGRGDSRPPLRVYGAAADRWGCQSCPANGTVIDLVGHALGVDPAGAETRAWFAAHGWCEAGRDGVKIPKVVRRPPPLDLGDTRRTLTDADVREVWDRCDFPPAAWLRSRALDPDRIEALDACRTLARGSLPSWAAHWRRMGCEAVIPLWGPDGLMSGLQGRRTADGPGRKSVAADDVRRIGIMACPGGQDVLAGRGGPSQVVVTEGEPDWLTWASLVSPTVAVLGLPGAGAWTAGLADRIPTGTQVLIRTHDDPKGAKYADLIISTLGGRCPVLDRARTETS